MATTLCLYANTEETKEKCLTDLTNARQFIVDLDKKYPQTVDFKENSNWLKLDEFLKHYDSFIELVDLSAVDVDGEIQFIYTGNMSVSSNDVESGQLDFDNSLSIAVPYEGKVDAIQVQMCVDLDVEQLSEEMDSYGYEIF